MLALLRQRKAELDEAYVGVEQMMRTGHGNGSLERLALNAGQVKDLAEQLDNWG